MHPILIRIGPLAIPSYGAFFALGIVVGMLVLLRLTGKEKFERTTIIDLVFYTLLCGLLGAKLLLLITNLRHYLAHPAELKYLLVSGGTFYGGLICGGLSAFWLIRKHKLDFPRLADCLAPAVALAHFFGRVGCFLAGCCYGRPAESFPLAATFTSTEAWQNTGCPLHVPLYPTQLFEAVANLLNFLFLFLLFRRRSYKGQVFAFYILNYSIIRFMLEYLRGDPDRGFIFGGLENPFLSISTSQFISLLGLVLAVFLFRIFKKSAHKKSSS